MLKQDKSASISYDDRSGLYRLRSKIWGFGSGSGISLLGWAGTEADLQLLLRKQEKDPQVVEPHPSCIRGNMTREDFDKYKNFLRLWFFRGKFFSESEKLSAMEVKALILESEERKKKRLKRAVDRMKQAETLASSSKRRKPIPDDVKMFVWRRDESQCVKCGSRESLEYDHIIPLSKGGSNTARNLQILCERCNREKGAHVA